MANEITTTTANDLVNSTLVQNSIIMALSEQPGLSRFCREFNLIGQPTLAASIPTETAYWGSANDDGVGLDTEFNGTEATSLSNTAVSTGVVTCTPTEYGVAHALTDNVGEDSVQGVDFLSLVTGRMLHVLNLAMDDDFLALFASLSNSVGTTTADLTLAQLIAAQQGIRVRGAVADSLVYILDNQQCSDAESALIAGSTSAAVFALSADRLINYAPTSDNGMSAMRNVMTFRGVPVYSSGLTDTANSGDDVVGACFCPSSAYNDASGATTFGMSWKRLPRFETQRQAKLRATDLVMTCRAGFAELQDGSGTKIVTDA